MMCKIVGISKTLANLDKKKTFKPQSKALIVILLCVENELRKISRIINPGLYILFCFIRIFKI
ncbi:MAG TPA: hypothetical protein DEO71_22360 [Chryseobacterium sp.]|nr:hypothetical protein [Chryseobacterium sp.]